MPKTVKNEASKHFNECYYSMLAFAVVVIFFTLFIVIVVVTRQTSHIQQTALMQAYPIMLIWSAATAIYNKIKGRHIAKTLT